MRQEKSICEIQAPDDLPYSAGIGRPQSSLARQVCITLTKFLTSKLTLTSHLMEIEIDELL